VKILGLDPGNAITGYGLILAEKGGYTLETFGALRTPAGMPAAQRLLMLYDALNQLIDKSQPEQVAIEQLFFNKNVKTAVPVGQARGILLLTCAQRELPVSEYTPLEVKQALTGYGRADKAQIQYMVCRLLKMDAPPKNDDAADALAIAITHAHYYHGRKIRGEIS
jgi:crossover junction endodeoxyribonuclease RuvC